MDATSRRICLTGVLKMNSFRDSFLFSSFSSPYFLLFGHGCRLLFPRLRRNETRNGRTVMALVNDIDRHCLSRCVNEKRFFSTSNAPVVLFPFLVSPPPFFFLPFFPRRGGRGGERLERKLKRLRGKMAPRDGNCYSHPLILK